jgi:hypothetical protein
MAGDPADVGGAPVDVVVVDIEDVFVREGRVEEIAGGAVDDALGFSGGAGGIEHEEIILGVHGFGGAFGGRLVHELVVPEIALGDDVAGGVIPFDNDNVLDAGRVFEGFVGDGFEGDVFAGAQGRVGCDEQFAGGIIDPTGERIGAEPAEHDGMDGADAGAGQHGDGELGDHRQIDGDSIALLDAKRFEDIGELTNFAVELRIGEGAGIRLGFALPDDGGFIGTGGEVSIEAIGGDIELAVFEPGVTDMALGGIPGVLEGAGGHFEPVECFGLFEPETVGILDRAVVHCLVLFGIEVRPLHHLGRRRKGAVFLEK